MAVNFRWSVSGFTCIGGLTKSNSFFLILLAKANRNEQRSFFSIISNLFPSHLIHCRPIYGADSKHYNMALAKPLTICQ
jgi:hypothetical protein